ncbi:Ankyrin repeat domain-containing protein 50 [Durusdinium trenchii]|uniref:Ankyrin repeat domain-containing protein 50 n=1 Tax=Durusdinium trenchii TaxID=1381693 RepID=A0ABP0I5D2_9DINO
MAMAAQGMSLGQPRASTFLSGRSQGKASACERLLEAKDAEVLRLRSELEAWRSKAAKPSGSSRRLHVDLSACQRHQEYSAKAAAKASRELCSQAAVNLEEARERLHLATESLEGCEAFSRDLRDSLMKQRAIETSAWESLREAEQLEDEVQLQIHVRHAHIEEADEELLRLQLLNNEEEARLAQTEKVINDITSKQEACRAVFRQGEWTWQQLVQEQKALDVELEAQRPRLREEQEEHAAAFQQLEEEFQVLESLGQNLPQQTRELLDANREEQESWRAALRHTEQELWVAQRHLREQQKRNTAALAQCRRLANTQEAHAQAEAKRSYASQEAALQEARLRLNKVQMQARQQATRQKVNNAFKAPIFQQRSKPWQVDQHVGGSGGGVSGKGTSKRVSSPRSCDALVAREALQEKELHVLESEEEQLASEVQLERQRVAGRCAERRELEYWQDCIERLSREDQWLTAECQSLEQDKDLQEQAAEVAEPRTPTWGKGSASLPEPLQ